MICILPRGGDGQSTSSRITNPLVSSCHGDRSNFITSATLNLICITYLNNPEGTYIVYVLVLGHFADRHFANRRFADRTIRRQTFR